MWWQNLVNDENWIPKHFRYRKMAMMEEKQRIRRHTGDGLLEYMTCQAMLITTSTDVWFWCCGIFSPVYVYFFYEKLGVILARNVLNEQMLKLCVCICVFCPAFRTWMFLSFYVNRIHGRGYDLCQSDSVSMFFGSSSSPALSPPPPLFVHNWILRQKSLVQNQYSFENCKAPYYIGNFGCRIQCQKNC